MRFSTGCWLLEKIGRCHGETLEAPTEPDEQLYSANRIEISPRLYEIPARADKQKRNELLQTSSPVK